MKPLFLPTFVALGWSVLPLCGQNPQAASTVGNPMPPLSAATVPATGKAEGTPADDKPLVADQNAATLEPDLKSPRAVEQVTDLAVLRQSGLPPVAASGDIERIAATYRESGKPETDCRKASLAVEQRVKLEPDELLSIVETEISANPQCACEIVKSAVLSSNAEISEVVSIVETAILAAPESMRLISQCAIAVSPDALAGIQALLARYDGNAGEGESAKSAKSAKDAKSPVAVVADAGEVAPSPNPLDFPGVGPVGPTDGGPGGTPLVPPLPPIILTPPVTVVDP